MRLWFLPLLFVCVACSEESSVADEQLVSATHKVDILFSPAGLGDSGYNDIILYGIQQSWKQHGFQLEMHQPNSLEVGWRDYETWLQEEADPGTDHLFIFASNDYEPLLRQNPPLRQEGKDILLFEAGSGLEHVQAFKLNMFGASYYIGRLASFIAPSAAVVKANPYDVNLTDAEEGFRQGFSAEETKFCETYYLSDSPSGGYNNPDSAYYLAFDIYQNHPFIYPLAGGSNMGIYKYTREYPDWAYTAGMDGDMSDYSVQIICSLVKRLDLALEYYVSRWISGESWGGYETYGIGSGYVDVSLSGNYVDFFTPFTEGLEEEAIIKEEEYEKNTAIDRVE